MPKRNSYQPDVSRLPIKKYYQAWGGLQGGGGEHSHIKKTEVLIIP